MEPLEGRIKVSTLNPGRQRKKQRTCDLPACDAKNVPCHVLSQSVGSHSGTGGISPT